MTDEPASAGGGSRELRICNRKGLHARASAKFVQCVDRFDAEVAVSKDGQTVSGSSIMGLMMLAAGIGSSITVTVSGTEADAALAAIADLVGNRFGEDE
jgi:Phosphotransferase System HPr (HPr) Family